MDKFSADEIASDPDLFVQFVFDSRHTFADIYTTLTCILAYGIKNLYQDTKDISELRRELVSNSNFKYWIVQGTTKES